MTVEKRGIFGFGSDGGVAPMSGSQKPPKRQKISKAAQTVQDLLSEADEITVSTCLVTSHTFNPHIRSNSQKRMALILTPNTNQRSPSR